MIVIVPVALLKLCGVVCASFIRRAHPDWSIVSLCAPIHSCLYLLSMILSSVWSSVCVQVNPCFKSNKAYYINFFREFDNDIAHTKVELMPGCPLKWLQTSKSCERLPGKVLAAVLLPLAKNWCWQQCKRHWFGTIPTTDMAMILHIFSCAVLNAKYSKSHQATTRLAKTMQ